MKWLNKGHEFDNMYDSIKRKKKYYLFGAGYYGNQYLKALKNEIEILGYIDNDAKKQGTKINGFYCYSLDEVKVTEDVGIIVTMAQLSRVKPVEQLQEYGYKKNEHFFLIEEFISVYYAYKHDTVYFTSISFLPSTACNLNCRHCLNFNPFAKQFYVRKWEDLTKDIDLFFSCVDRIVMFHVSGGEPMLYKYTADLMEYIDKNYGSRIDALRTTTNGTIVPKEEVLIKFAQCNVEVTVDDYRDAVPQFNEKFDELIRKLDEYHIKYYINKVDSWIDLAPEKTDYSGWTDEQLEKHREACDQRFQELRDGKIYSCNYAAYAEVAGIVRGSDSEDIYNLKDFSQEKKKELVEFRLGYTTKGYTSFCKTCRGFTSENQKEVEPAAQVK